MGEGDPKGERRREFLGSSIAGTATVLGVTSAYPIVRFLTPRDEASQRAATAGEAEKFFPGTSKTVLLGDRPVLVIRLEDGSFRAFSAVCTHLQCVVAYSTQNKQIECPCHRGVYSLEGQNIAGPPPKPLQAFAVHVLNGVVTITEA